MAHQILHFLDAAPRAEQVAGKRMSKAVDIDRLVYFDSGIRDGGFYFVLFERAEASEAWEKQAGFMAPHCQVFAEMGLESR
jgi:hypothetical protein